MWDHARVGGVALALSGLGWVGCDRKVFFASRRGVAHAGLAPTCLPAKSNFSAKSSPSLVTCWRQNCKNSHDEMD